MNIVDLLKILQNEVASGNGHLEVHTARDTPDHWGSKLAPQVYSGRVLHVEHNKQYDMSKLTDDDGTIGTKHSRKVFIID